MKTEAMVFSVNGEVVIRPKHENRPCWKGLIGKKARIVSCYTKAVVVELDESKELFVLQKKDIRVANEENN